MPSSTAKRARKTASKPESNPVGRPRKDADPGSFPLQNGNVVTLEHIIRLSKDRTMKQTAEALGTSVTTFQKVRKHFGLGNWMQFTITYKAGGNAVGPAPGNGAAAVGSAPGNGDPQPTSSLFTPGESDNSGTWSPSPFADEEPKENLPGDDEEPEENLPGDEGTGDELMSTNDENPGEHNVAPPEEAMDSDPLGDNTATVNGHMPWPFADTTNRSPTDPLPGDISTKGW